MLGNNNGRARVRARGITQGQSATKVGQAPAWPLLTPADFRDNEVFSSSGFLGPSRIPQRDNNGLPHGDVESTFVKRNVKMRQNFMDLGICTREKLAHVKDCKTGSSGIPVMLVTNLFNLDLPQDWQLYQYHVTYIPELESRKLRIALLYSQSILSNKAKAFDGTVLFLSQKLEEKVTELSSETRRGETVKMTVTLMRELPSSSPVCIQVFNIIFKKLSLWPGFAISVSYFENRLLLSADVSYKVLRNETVLEFMTDLCYRTGVSCFTQTCEKQLIGLIVLTRYNNKTYRIDDIDWSVKPTHTFQRRDGSQITYVDYYQQQYNITISDLNQPVLVSLLKSKKNHNTEAPIVHLMPELCFLTGLTDQATSDFQLMKAVAEETRLSPLGRQQRLARLADDIQSIKVQENPSAFLRAIQQHVDPDVQLVMCILSSNQKNYYDSIKKYLSLDCPVPSQCVLTRTLNKQGMMMSVATKIAMQMTCKLGGELWAVEIPLKSLMVVGIDICKDTFNREVAVVGFVASLNPRITRWFSRCILQKTTDIADCLKVFMTGALNKWYKHNHSLPARIIVYRDGVGDGQLKTIVEYEVPQLLSSVTESSSNISVFYSEILYFNLKDKTTTKTKTAKLHELVLVDFFLFFSSVVPSCRLSVIVVRKKCMPRFFTEMNHTVQNPPLGTVVDAEATRPKWYDFYLISQTACRGTVSPTYYNVIYDDNCLKPDHMQRLTFKLCHLYYNWQGLISIPAPCQYAHKLTFLVAQSIHKEPNLELANSLFYL
ncbi:Hypothetical predicted protein [Marmota monax]|uniref:Piwi domain-containing protein n=1 Tax=Marmota monax TaxID=9995 RepID=A0A5E4BZJ6_MARMO|nr:Hypothetical predicted protein [Marmota monax]